MLSLSWQHFGQYLHLGQWSSYNAHGLLDLKREIHIQIIIIVFIFVIQQGWSAGHEQGEFRAG
jgi:hypothetical protein